MNKQPVWWSPEQLSVTEREVRESAQSKGPDIRNDYGAYHALAAGADPVASGLYLHNEYENARIERLCSDYAMLVRRAGIETPQRVADLGCGAGFTSDGLKRKWPSAKVVGYEVSRDAVAYARQHWRACQFVEGAIEPEAELAAGPFDVILCQEFYPFTRTEDYVDHELWLRYVCRNLTSTGIGIITVSSANQQSLNGTYYSLKERFELNRMKLAAPRLARRLPFPLSMLTGQLLGCIRPTWARSVYLVKRGD